MKIVKEKQNNLFLVTHMPDPDLQSNFNEFSHALKALRSSALHHTKHLFLSKDLNEFQGKH